MAGLFEALTIPIKLPNLNFKFNSPSNQDVTNKTVGLYNHNTYNIHYPEGSKPTVGTLVGGVKDSIDSFQGREDILQKLSENIEQSISKGAEGLAVRSLIHVLCGVGGAGKTQTVRKYILDNKTKYSRIIWIKAATYKDARRCFLQIAEDSNIKIRDSKGKQMSDEDITSEIFKVVCKRKSDADGNTDDSRSSLFVLDNVEEIGDPLKKIRNLLPQSIPADWNPPVFIVTTRQSNWESLPAIDLKGFNDDESWNLLANSLNLEDTPENRGLVEEVRKHYDGLPLVMQQVISFIKGEDEIRKYTLKDFLSEVKQHEQRFLKTKPEDCDVKENVFAIYELTAKKLSSIANGKAALNCLDVMALLDPDNVPRDLIRALMKGTDVEILNLAMTLLKSYGLISENKSYDYYEIHRLVQLVRKQSKTFTVMQTEPSGFLDQLKQSTKKMFLSSTYHQPVNVVSILNNYREFIDSANMNNYSNYNNGLILLETVTENKALLKIKSEVIFNFVDTVAAKTHGWFYDGGLTPKFLKIAIAIAEKEKNVEIICDRKIKLANDYRERHYEYDTALKHYTEVIALQEKCLPANHPDTLKTMEYVADLYKDQRKFQESAQVHEEILAKRLQSYGPIHEDTLAAKTNLALMYAKQRKYEQAKLLYSELIPEIEKQLPKTLPVTLETMIQLAIRLDVRNKFNEAKILHQQMLTQTKKYFAEKQVRFFVPTAKFSFRRIYPLVVMYGDQSIQIEAEKIMKFVVSEWEKEDNQAYFPIETYGIDKTVWKLETLAAVYVEYGKHKKAEDIYIQLLALNTKLESEVKIMETKMRLANLYQRQDKCEKAEELLKDVLPYIRQKLEISDSDSWATRNDRAQSYKYQGDYAKATEIYKYNLLEEENSRIKSPPEELITKISLARVLMLQNEYAYAEILYAELLSQKEKTMARSHKETTLKLAIAKLRQKKVVEAEKLYNEVIEGRETPLCTSDDYPLVANKENLLLVNLHREIISIQEETLRSNHGDTLDSINDLALIHFHEHEYDESVKLFQRLLSAKDETLGADHADVLRTKLSLAIVYFNNDGHDEAEKLFQEVILQRKNLMQEDPVWSTLHSVAEIYFRHFRNKDLATCLATTDVSDKLKKRYEQEINGKNESEKECLPFKIVFAWVENAEYNPCGENNLESETESQADKCSIL